MTTTIDIETTYEVIDCDSCGTLFCVTAQFDGRRRKDKKDFYCPNGHSLSYGGKSDTQLRREAEQKAASAIEDARIASIARDRAERELAAAQRAAKLAEKRARAAVCPVPGCNRSFVQLQRHLHSKHPEFAHPADC